MYSTGHLDVRTGWHERIVIPDFETIRRAKMQSKQIKDLCILPYDRMRQNGSSF